MRIKEVEKLTGLTAKAIRLYESKGLLNVARETENDYRDYTEEDVQRLKTIALLRKLDVPLGGIREWTDGKITLREILQKASIQNREASRESELRHQLSTDLAQLLEKDPEMDICELVKDLEELQELLKELDQAIKEDGKHIIWPVMQTIISLGPVLLTVMYILEGRTERALIGFVCSLILVPLCIWFWIDYFRAPKTERRRNGCLSILLIGIGTLVLMFGIATGLSDAQQMLYVQRETDILLVRKPWDTLFIVFEFEIMGTLLLLWKKPWKNKRWKTKWVAASAIALVIGNAALLYGCITGVSVASEEGIYRYSFFCPDGKMIPYADIRNVNTGFKGKTLGLAVNHTGDFYYELTFADGSVEDWGSCTCAEEEVTWSWMTRLDEWVMAGGAEKTGTDEYWKFCEMDQFYVDILRDVINNR